MLADLRSGHYESKEAACRPGGDVCRRLYNDK